MEGENFEKIELEVIATSNPLSVNINGISKIHAMELDTFCYVPKSVPAIDFLGVAIQGIRGRYDRFGNQQEIIRTLPQLNNRFNTGDTAKPEEDLSRFYGSGTSINIGFVNKDPNSLQFNSPVVFDNNYLIVLNLFCER